MREYRTDINRQEYPRLRAYTWLYSIAAAGVIVALVFTLWLTSVMVLDGGMSPTFEHGDIILFSRLSHHIRTPRRGEAYIFGNEDSRIGRVVGLPGDTVAMQGGRVYIDGLYLDESSYATLSGWEMDEITLGKGEFLILPDERTKSELSVADARVEADELIGRAVLRVSPIGRAAIFTAKAG